MKELVTTHSLLNTVAKGSLYHKANGFLLIVFHFYHDSENKDGMQVKDGKLQSSNYGNVSKDRIDNVDNTAHLKDVDVLHEDSLTSKVHFPIDITTTQEISSMNQNNCISAESLQRFQQWKPGLEHKECCINDEVSFKATEFAQ